MTRHNTHYTTYYIQNMTSRNTQHHNFLKILQQNLDGINFAESLLSTVSKEEDVAYLRRHVVPTLEVLMMMMTMIMMMMTFLLQLALANMYKAQPSRPLLWLADWLTQNNPNITYNGLEKR